MKYGAEWEIRDVMFGGLRGPYREAHALQRSGPWSMGEHSHSFFQIILVLDGVLRVDCGGTVWRLSRGQAHVLPPGYSHALSSQNGYGQLGVDVDCVSDERDILPLLRDYFSRPAAVSCPEALSDAEALLDVSAVGNRIAGARQATLLDAIMIRLLTAHTRAGAERFDMRLSEYVDAHLQEKITLEAVAAEFHMSVPQLERMTRRHFGGGVMELRSQRRLNRARLMLTASEESISKIAEELGFCDLAHFSHFFRQRCGVSPSEYRREVHREKQ